jgi:hypothetical protein
VLNTRRSLVFALGLTAAVLAGCQQSDEIRRYQVPRVEPPEFRLLGAMVSHGDHAWFFKVLGPAPAVAEQKDPFDRFLHSVRFTGKSDPPLTWTVPQGWREEPKGAKREQMPGMERYATFLLPSKERDLQLTVVQLRREGKAESVLDNVNRWRTQFVGLPPLTEEELGKATTKVALGDADATVVDMTGPGPRSGMRPPMAAAAPAPAPAEEGRAPLEYKLPEGWKKGPPKAFSVVTLRTGDGGLAAEVTVSPVGGGRLLNVNRWRDQLGLGPVSEEQLRKDLREIPVAGGKGAYVELIGPEKDGGRRSILGVMAEDAGTPWVFKMTGPADVVARQKPAFEAFVSSVRFDGGKRE